VANHRRQSINKAHSIPYLKSSERRLGAIQSCLHYIQPSIGVGFKILVGAPLFCPLDGQTKGGVVVGTTGGIVGKCVCLCVFCRSLGERETK
jgi:hypothetical protein